MNHDDDEGPAANDDSGRSNLKTRLVPSLSPNRIGDTGNAPSNGAVWMRLILDTFWMVNVWAARVFAAPLELFVYFLSLLLWRTGTAPEQGLETFLSRRPGRHIFRVSRTKYRRCAISPSPFPAAVRTDVCSPSMH